MIRRLVAGLLAVILAIALYATVPAESATPAPTPLEVPPGAVLVQAYVYDGMTWHDVPGGIAVPPVGCAPGGGV